MLEIFLYDSITTGAAKSFVEQLNAINGPLVVRINSGGGSMFEGLAIYNAILRRGRVTTKIDGLAASIASLIALAGDKVEMADNALLMVHNPWAGMSGDSAELRKQATLLDKAKDAMIAGYAAKSGKTPDEISQIMDAETWYTADEALKEKFIDSIYPRCKWRRINST